jgi:Phage portal protein
MKWMRWFAGLFGSASKSIGSLGVGLRAALGGGSPGGWASDHREETLHNTGFNYIAIHAIASQVAGATVTVFADRDQQALRQSKRKSLAVRAGSFTRWKSIYGAEDRETDPLPTIHPLVRLLKRPNPYESGASFRYRQAQQIRLTGTCLIWNVPSVSGPACERYVIPTAMASPVAPTAELPQGGWRINPVASRYTPIVDDGFIDCPSWYRILGQIVDARQVQVIRLPHAWYLDDGQSPLSAGAKWVDAGEAIDDARFHQLRNGIDPSIVWNLPPDVSPDQNEIDRMQAKISAKYGGPENVGRVMLAQAGTSITPLSTSPKEMCYSEGFHDFKAATLALHQTPPVAVGLQEPGAYAAYNASMKAWRHAAVQPLCDLLAESDTEHLAPQFGVGLTVEIESDTIDDTDLIEKQLQNDLAARVRTRNEWRAVRGMPPLPGRLGNELVGTDSGAVSDNPRANGSATEDTNPRLTQRGRSNETEDSSTKAFFGSPDVMQQSTGDEQRSGDRRFDLPIDPDRGSDDRNPSWNSNKKFEDADRARLTGEMQDGWFGKTAPSRLDPDRASVEKSFDEGKHPRDEKGRFAREAVARILKSPPGTDRPEKVAEHFSYLSTRVLKELHRDAGISSIPHTREHLERSVLSRVIEFPRSATRTFLSPTGSHKISVHLQNEEKCNERLPQLPNGETRPPLTEKQWANLVGAQPGAVVHVFPTGFTGFEIFVDHPDYMARRKFGSGLTITNEIMIVAPSKQKQGIAARATSQQVETATGLGYKFIEAGAAGKGTEIHANEEDWVTQGLTNPAGYYTWARLGFNAPLSPLMDSRANHPSDELRTIAADFYQQFARVKTVAGLMQTERGRNWWKKYGGYFEGRFDLAAESVSRRVLTKYLAEKGIEIRKKSLAVSEHDQWPGDEAFFVAMENGLPCNHSSDGDQSEFKWRNDKSIHCENPDVLTAEDEEILDRIWNAIGCEKHENDNDVSDYDERTEGDTQP